MNNAIVKSGMIVIDKPAGITSAGVVNVVKRRLLCKKAGHTGTLDPLATGVLPICVEEATKIAGLILSAEKAYEVTARFGVRTDTLDVTGQITNEQDPGEVLFCDFSATMPAFCGEILQMPPAFSALRVGGVRAYSLARKGKPVALEPRSIRIDTLRITDWAWPVVRFYVECSKGTYIRALVRDIGEKIGCGAVVEALRRTRTGAFTLEHSIPLTALETNEPPDIPWISIDAALTNLPMVEVPPADGIRLAQGQLVPCSGSDATLCRVHCDGMLLCLGEVLDGRMKPRRVFGKGIGVPLR